MRNQDRGGNATIADTDTGIEVAPRVVDSDLISISNTHYQDPIRVAEAAGLELVVGLRRPGAEQPVAIGALVSNADDGLADFLPMKAPSPFDGPADR